MSSDVREVIRIVLTFACILAACSVVFVFMAHQEAATYNRLTGADVTWWDALWVDLRVMDAPKK
jgi:hypothetical protein